MKITFLGYLLTFTTFLSHAQADISDIQRSVVSILSSSGACNGVLLNNTEGDGRALVLTASHCFSDPSQTLFFTFNRDILTESPVVRSVEWTTSSKRLLAQSTDLDFALYELEDTIPAYIRPYFSGWAASPQLPIASYGIHSLAGDLFINKESNVPEYETLTEITFYGGTPIENGTIWIKEWEAGFTDLGSSGSPLFDQHGFLKGILSAGASTATNPTNDFYSRFDLIYDFNTSPDESIRSYLNRSPEILTSLDGFQYPNSRQNNFTYYPSSLSFRTPFAVEEYFENEANLMVYGAYVIVGDVVPGDVVIITLNSGSTILAQSQVFSQDLTPFSENFIPIDAVEVEGDYSLLIENGGSVEVPFVQNVSGATLRIDEAMVENTSALFSILTNLDDNSTVTTDEDLVVYPIPVIDNLFLSGSVDIDKIHLLDAKGTEIPISVIETISGDYLISLSNEKDGIYYLDDGRKSYKILIRR